MGALIDNDVIIKIAVYGFGNALSRVATINQTPPAMLSVGRFVVRDRLSRDKRFADRATALASFDELLPGLLLLEPTEEEISTAAEFESAATKANLELDGGESQLLAMLLGRPAELLLTGDKRAIVAIASIVGNSVQGRLACFEQLVGTVVGHLGADAFCKAVCREPLADKAITICCSCASGTVPEQVDLFFALASYINHVRKSAAGVLFGGENLATLTT